MLGNANLSYTSASQRQISPQNVAVIYAVNAGYEDGLTIVAVVVHQNDFFDQVLGTSVENTEMKKTYFVGNCLTVLAKPRIQFHKLRW